MFDTRLIAHYLIDHSADALTTVKLDMLVFYSHAWHLVWEGEPLIDSPIIARINGPAVTHLHFLHHGEFFAQKDMYPLPDNGGELTEKEISTIDAVLETYDQFTGQELRDMARSHTVWRTAYARGNNYPMHNEDIRTCYHNS